MDLDEKAALYFAYTGTVYLHRDTPDTPDAPDAPDAPDTPDTPAENIYIWL